MYMRLNTVQDKIEAWIKKSWKEGKWAPNGVINADGELIDARLKGGLRPSPVTRDLTWGVPVPSTGDAIDEEMKSKVLCTFVPSSYFSMHSSLDVLFRCLGKP